MFHCWQVEPQILDTWLGHALKLVALLHLKIRTGEPFLGSGYGIMSVNDRMG